MSTLFSPSTAGGGVPPGVQSYLDWGVAEGELANAQTWSATPMSTMKTVAEMGPQMHRALVGQQASQAYANALDRYNAQQKGATQNQIAGLGNILGGSLG